MLIEGLQDFIFEETAEALPVQGSRVSVVLIFLSNAAADKQSISENTLQTVCRLCTLQRALYGI